MTTVRRVSIQTESIELGALLKWTGLAPTGGEAKRLIQHGGVSVNGQTERRRGRRLQPGDRVEVRGRAVIIERRGAR
jgi:ribosome-associated protein